MLAYMSPRSGFELGLKRDRSYFYFNFNLGFWGFPDLRAGEDPAG